MSAPRRFHWLTNALEKARGKPIDEMSMEEIEAARGPYLQVADGRVGEAVTAIVGRIVGTRTPAVSTTETTVPGADSELNARRHEPDGSPRTDRPLILHVHGGGWVLGSPIQYDPLCTRLAADLDAVVVSVDYRKAPEHRAPSAADDVRAVATWLARDGASEVGATGPLAIGGDSAGGNLSALAAIALRDAGLDLAAQFLIYPATDMTLSSPSSHELHSEPILSRANMEIFVEMYLDGHDADDPAVSPHAVDDLAKLAPALVITGERDPLRDEGRAYAERLRGAGVDVRYTEYRDMPHGFVSLPGLSISARQANDEIVEFLRLHLGV